MFESRSFYMPAIIHFDVPTNHLQLETIYNEVMAKAYADPDLQTRLTNGILKIYATVTDQDTYLSSTRDLI